jgi:uncharacterized protein
MKETAYRNIKLLKGFYDAVSHGQLEAARTLLAPNVEWVEPSLPGLWFSGTHRGAEAVVKDVILPATEKLEHFHLKMKKFFAVGDHVIAIGSFRGRNRYTQLELEADTAHIWTFRQGKAVRFEGIHDPSSWEEVLGLPRSEFEGIAA